MVSILDKEFDIHQHLFIEASAGTGKTFTIQHLLVRSILESEALLPQSCAIITFTRAVAEELNERIAASLDQAIDGLKKCLPVHSYLEPYLTDEQERISALDRLILFRREIETAKITTIHGFCFQLLQRFEGFACKWLEPVEQKKLIEELIELEVTEESISLGQFQAIRRLFRFDDTKLISALMGQYNAQETLIPDIHAALDSLCASGMTSESVRDALDDLITKFTKPKGDATQTLQAIADLFNPLKRKSALYILERDPGVIVELYSKPLKRQKGPIGHDSILRVIKGDLEGYLSPESAFRKLHKQIQEAFYRVCESRSLLTYDLLIKKIFDLSQQNPEFCKWVREAFQLVVVDEFQDTDLQQWSIISRIFLENPWDGHLYLVGDPKQSIYAFRSADIYSYLEARSAIRSHTSLSTNFRANDSLVQALNTIFTAPHAETLFKLPKTNSSLKVEPVLAHRKGLQAHSPLELVLFYGSLGRKRNWPHEEMELEFFYPWLSHRIRSFVKDGYSHSQIAILVKDRFQAFRLSKYLEEHNIPASCLKTLSILESPALTLFKALYGWVLHPKKLSRLKELLSFQKEGFSSKAMQSIDSSLDLFGAYVDEVEALRKSALKHGVAVIFDQWLRTPIYPSNRLWVEELTERSDAEELFRDCSLLLDLIAEPEGQRPDIGKAYHLLCHLEDQYGSESELLQRRFDPDRDSVTIVTTHKSKGLEFDIVIPLGVSCRSPNPSRLDQENAIIEREAEKARLLYVALTRARERILLPIFIDRDEKEIAFGTASPVEIMTQLSFGTTESACGSLVELSNGTISVHSALRVSDVKKDAQLPIIPQLQHQGNFNWITQKHSSFSRKFQKGESLSAVMSEPDGRMVGIQLHLFMEKLITEHWEKIADWESVEALARWYKLHPDCIAGIKRILYTPLEIENRSIILAELSQKALHAEMPFCINEEEELLHGSIDCVVRLEDAIFAIDWKSHLVQSVSSASSELGCQEQANMYKKALNLWSGASLPCLGVVFFFVRVLDGENHVIC